MWCLIEPKQMVELCNTDKLEADTTYTFSDI